MGLPDKPFLDVPAGVCEPARKRLVCSCMMSDCCWSAQTAAASRTKRGSLSSLAPSGSKSNRTLDSRNHECVQRLQRSQAREYLYKFNNRSCVRYVLVHLNTACGEFYHLHGRTYKAAGQRQRAIGFTHTPPLTLSVMPEL